MVVREYSFVSVCLNPALKLLEFYEEMSQEGSGIKMSNRVTIERSQTLKGLEGVSKGWMELWLRQWNF